MKKKKKILARILIEGNLDPNTGIRTLDVHYDGKDTEICALLFKTTVEFCRDSFHFSDDRIIELFKMSVNTSNNQNGGTENE